MKIHLPMVCDGGGCGCGLAGVQRTPAHHNLDLGPGPRQNVYNGQVLKHSSVQVPKHSNVQVLKHSDVQVLKHSSVQVPKDPNVEVLNHSNVQKFKWKNWKEIM